MANIQTIENSKLITCIIPKGEGLNIIRLLNTCTSWS